MDGTTTLTLLDDDDPSSLTLDVRPWPDSVIDELGHDPRSPYVERFWLGILGPSSIMLLRRLAADLEASPAGYELPLDETARSLGLTLRGGRTSSFMRTVLRCAQFRLLHYDDHGGCVLARRKLPPLTRTQVLRLPQPLQRLHQQWVELPAAEYNEQLFRRGCRLALSLLELGEDAEAAERQLHRWRFHPTMARDATAWAVRRHRDAAQVATTVTTTPAGGTG